MTLGTAFLVIKGFEYHHKWVHHLIPGKGFHLAGTDDPAAQTFFVLYFCMTGLHALLIVGPWPGRSSRRSAASSAENHELGGVGLYWHFVDIVWIFLFLLTLLVGAH